MEHVRWLAEPHVRAPTLVGAFTGWNDAGDAASTAVRTMVEQWGATAIAEIDPEPFTDFATVRPHVRLDAGRRTIVWPTVGLWSVSTLGGDVLLALGPEPALRWQLFCRQFVEIVQRVRAPMVISLGALLADVPHSRPVQVIGTASDPDVIERYDLQQSRYEGPTGIVGVITDSLARAGVATASLWAAVPGYAAQLPSPKATMALLRRSCRMLGTPPPDAGLAAASEDYERRLSTLVDDDDDLRAYVARLETLVDDEAEEESSEAAPDDTDDRDLDTNVDPDQLVAEVERFLRDRDAED